MTNSNDMPLAAHAIDRAAHFRTNEDWQASAIRRDDVLVFLMREGEPCLDGSPVPNMAFGRPPPDGVTKPLFWMGPEALTLSDNTRTLFLGVDKNETPIFAIDLPKQFSLEGSLIAGAAHFADMRGAAGLLSPLEANIAATARSLFLWHDANGFCAKCGSVTGDTDAGWKRQCPNCGTEHWPRTDPVAIMLATRGDKALLGRGKGWPEGFLSCLAGFCEPGETIEQAAARELREEAGIIADPAKTEYVACQPWPFISSLMVGLILPADTDEIKVDPAELEHAEWISRDDARQMLAEAHPTLFCPPKTAIAHHILKEWAMRD